MITRRSRSAFGRDVAVIVARAEECSLIGSAEHRIGPLSGLRLSHSPRFGKKLDERLDRGVPEVCATYIGYDVSKGRDELQTGVAKELRHLTHDTRIGHDGIDDRFVSRLSRGWIIACKGQRRVITVEDPHLSTRFEHPNNLREDRTWIVEVAKEG